MTKSIGLLGAFAAREVFVSTMGVVYGIGEDVDEESVGLRQRIQQEAHADGRPIYAPLVGLSLMVFFAIACQCMSTLAVVKRETRSHYITLTCAVDAKRWRPLRSDCTLAS